MSDDDDSIGQRLADLDSSFQERRSVRKEAKQRFIRTKSPGSASCQYGDGQIWVFLPYSS